MRSKVLVIRPGAFGDVCMAVPFVAALARHCDVHWLIRQAYAPIPQMFGVDCRLVSVSGFHAGLAEQLRREQYDAVLDLCHWPVVASLVSQMKDVPVRAATFDPVQDERLGINPGNFELHDPFNRLVPLDGIAHQVDKWCALARVALGIRIKPEWPLPAQREIGRPLQLFVQPHASKPEKRWPIHRFAQVVRGLAGRVPLVCHINSGNRAELPRAISLWLRLRTSGIRAHIVWLDRSYRRLTRVLRQADLALGCDSGPMHFAALLGAPTVVVYGPHAASEFGPRWRSRTVEPWGPAEWASRIAPNRVLQALHASVEGVESEAPGVARRRAA